MTIPIIVALSVLLAISIFFLFLAKIEIEKIISNKNELHTYNIDLLSISKELSMECEEYKLLIIKHENRINSLELQFSAARDLIKLQGEQIELQKAIITIKESNGK